MQKFVYVLFALVIQCVSPTESGECTQPIFCSFAGTLSWTANYRFNLSDIQNELGRCKIISYSRYQFDLNDKTGKYMNNEDKENIKLLTENGKTVYQQISYVNDNKWFEILNNKYEDTSKPQIDALVKFLQDYNIGGIIMENIALYADDTPPIITQQIIAFANRIKTLMNNNLKVGLKINGKDFKWFTYVRAIDYTALNDVIDQYFIDMTILNDCSPLTQKEGVNPITTGTKLLTLAEMSAAVEKSAMDKCKVYAIIQVPLVESYNNGIINNNYYIYGSYSKVCFDYSNKIDVKLWCLDSTSTLYKQTQFVRKYFSGLMLSMLEGDDYTCDCGCQKYPVSNTLIDGWESSELKYCEKIDEIDGKNME